MRASGVPIVRMQAMSSDAMAKKLFQDLVAEALTPQSFVDFKRRCVNEGVGRIALVVTLDIHDYV